MKSIVFVIFFVLFLSPVISFADEFIVVDQLKAKPMSTTAREFEMTDVNDRKCALIIIYTDVDLTGAVFDANPMVCGSKNQAKGEWWLYVSPGANNLKIKKAGFIPFVYEVPYGISIEASGVYELKITNKDKNIGPEKEILPEFVVVKSIPDKAKVSINGEPKGTTPVNNLALFPGSYKYKLEKENYYPAEGEFVVETGKKASVEATLKPRFGSITVTSQPETGADILLDNQPLNQKTPYTIPIVASGEHVIEVQKDMFDPASQKITVADGVTESITINMSPLFGNIVLTSIPADAEIYIDREKKSTGKYTGRLLNGIHVIEVKSPKYETTTKSVDIKTGASETLNIELKPKTGTISVVTDPGDAEIWVNGEKKGQSPLFIRNLLIGNYSLELKLKDYGTVSKTVTVEENKTVEVSENLPFGEKVVITTIPAGASIKIDGNAAGTAPYSTSLKVGSYKIMAVSPSPDYVDAEETITVVAGAENKFSITLKRDPKTVKMDRKIVFSGTVMNEANVPLKASISVIDNSSKSIISKINTDQNTGVFNIDLPFGKNYFILFESAGFIFHSENFDLPETSEYKEVQKNITLKKIEAGKTVILKNVFFDYAKATLRPESSNELDILVSFLNANPGATVEISGHSDNRGSSTTNEKLTENRAKSIVDYLVSKGVNNPARISYKGYGFSKPVSSNDTEEGRQMNRRTEFTILTVASVSNRRTR